MKRDCPIVLNQCPEADSPITNTSSEAPDPILFWGVGWTQFDPFRPRPLGNGPITDDVDCSNISYSTDNQALADLWAFIYAQICEDPPTPPIPGVPPFPPPPEFVVPPLIGPMPTIQFGELETKTCGNDRQEATVECPDGSIFSMAVEANTYTATLPIAVCDAWVEYINAYLLSWILDNMLDMRVCPEIPGLDERTEPGTEPDPIPPPGPGVPPPLISSHPGWCCLGASLVASQFTYTLTGGPTGAEWTFSLTGSIPPGTALVQTGPNTAVLTGTPTVAGDYNFAIVATYATSTLTINDTLHVFGLESTSLPDAENGTAYSATITAAGGTAPYTFSGASGLPAGLTMDANGNITGTPSEDGDFTVTATVTDSVGGFCEISASLFVGAGLPDPGDTVWVTSTFDFFPANQAIAVPAPPGGTQSNFRAYISSPGNWDAWSNVQGTLTYIGPATTFRISGTLIGSDCGINQTTARLNASATIGGLPVPGIGVGVSNAPFPPAGYIPWVTGPFSIDLVVPDTGGLVAVVTFDLYMRWNFCGPYTFDMTADVTAL